MSREEVVAHQRRRLFQGIGAAVTYHGYEDTKITDVVELAGVSRATFYEHFEGKEGCFAAAYADGVAGLERAVSAAATDERAWTDRISAGLRAGLEFLAADGTLAHLLLVEALAASRSLRLEHERSLARLAEVMRPPASELAPSNAVTGETARLLAGGLTSHLSGMVLAGEVERLPERHDVLLQYLLAPYTAAVKHSGEPRLADAI